MPFVKPRCSYRGLSATGPVMECTRPQYHGGKWHKNGDLRWRVTRELTGADLKPPAEPHLHTLQLALTGQGGAGIGQLVVPLACGTDITRQCSSG